MSSLRAFVGITRPTFRLFSHNTCGLSPQTVKPTPAMAAGVESRLWELGDIVKVVEAWEAALG
jgi:hypothetical protein